MPNDDTHPADDLFADTLGDDDSRMSDESTPSESEDLLNDTPPAKDAKSEAAQAQIAAWTRKITSGEASIEELETKQKWLVPHVKSKLDTSKGSDKDEMRRLAKEAAQELFTQSQQEVKEQVAQEQYDTLLATIKELTLTPIQKAKLTTEYKDLVSDGIPKHKALQKAARYADIDFEDTASVRRSMASVKQGSGGNNQESEPDYDDPNFDPNAQPLEKIFANARKLAQKGGMRVG